MWNIGLLHTLDPRARGTLLERAFQLEQCALWSLGDNLDRTIPQVPRVPGNPKALGLTPNKPPESHPLDLAPHQEARPGHASPA